MIKVIFTYTNTQICISIYKCILNIQYVHKTHKKRRNKSFIYRKVYTDRSFGRGRGTRKKDRIEIVGE